MTGIKIPAPLFICKHSGIPGAAAPVAELLLQVQQGFMHHSLQVSLHGDGREGQLDEASAVWRILLKLAPRLQKAFLGTTSFKKAGKYKHIGIRPRTWIWKWLGVKSLFSILQKASQPTIRPRGSCGSCSLTSQLGGLRDR